MTELKAKIARVTATEVLAGCRDILGTPGDGGGVMLDGALLASLARRSAGIHCPCSRATLRHSLLECMHGLPASFDSLPDAIDDAIEALVVGGDLLELSDVVIDDSDVKQTWVFAAPPRFVARPNRPVFLIGVVADQDTFLPSALNERVVNRGYARVLEPQAGENLPRELRELGLQELSDRTWLKAPRVQTHTQLLEQYDQLLGREQSITAIPDVQILDSAQPVQYYRGRWSHPTDQSGTFIARRPQEFGAPIWCLVKVRNGQPVRLLDLPLPRSRWRGCDEAWHLQTAIDHGRGAPQRYRRRVGADGIRLDFFSPLPQWSERRLMILGQPARRDRCLFSYILPADESDGEEAFLRQNLWLAPDDDSC